MALPTIQRCCKLDCSGLLIIILLSICSPNTHAQTTPASIQDFSWILGNWKIEERNSYEKWTLHPNAAQLTGISYSLTDNGDTTITERLSISYEAGSWYYFADVPDNGKAIRFKIVQHTHQGFRSENKEHDYPQYIAYQLETTDKLRAEVGNTQRKQVFILERQQPK